MKGAVLLGYIVAFSCTLYWAYDGSGSVGLDEIGLSFLIGVCAVLLVLAVDSIIWRLQNDLDLTDSFETDIEKVKARLLSIMENLPEGGEGAIKSLNTAFRIYPEWKLQKWDTFRAWYKAIIDFMTSQPHLYRLTIPGGMPYRKELDPLYDPEAPDWELFDNSDSLGENDDDFDIDSVPFYDDEGEEYESEEEYREYKRFSRRHDDVDLEEFREFKEYKELHCDDYLSYDEYRRRMLDEEEECSF
ncbi:MAG: hypothetical protein K2L28_07805 [Muribaculaceae bacterium]|nr:hypothetical protein [Muribaculaceae bacterium]